MPDIRERISAEVSRARLPDVTADEIAANIEAMVESHTRQPRGIDQGVSRLALRAFTSGLGDHEWNGSADDGGSGQWIRYRGHHVSRESSDEGWIVEIAYHDHTGKMMVARYHVGTTVDPNSPVNVDQDWTASTLRAIDDLIDDALTVHGADGTPLVDAEILENIDGATARRVIDRFSTWIIEQPTLVVPLRDLVDRFAAEVEAGEVTP